MDRSLPYLDPSRPPVVSSVDVWYADSFLRLHTPTQSAESPGSRSEPDTSTPPCARAAHGTLRVGAYARISACVVLRQEGAMRASCWHTHVWRHNGWGGLILGTVARGVAGGQRPDRDTETCEGCFTWKAIESSRESQDGGKNCLDAERGADPRRGYGDCGNFPPVLEMVWRGHRSAAWSP